MDSPLTNPLTYGGIILALSGVIVRLYTENRALYRKIESMYEARLESQDKVAEKLVQHMELTAERDKMFYERLTDAKK